MSTSNRINHRLQAVIITCALLLSAALSSAQPLEWHGQFIQGGLVWGKLEPGSKMRWQDREIAVGKEGLFVLGFGRSAKLGVSLTIINADGAQSEWQHTLIKREYNIQRIDGVPAKTVNPDPEYYQRIGREAKLVKQARKQFFAKDDFTKPFKWPLLGPITGVFGSQRVYNGVLKRPHYGVDVAAATGTVVKSPLSGRVVLSEPDLFFSGGTLIIDHGFGVSSTMMHLSKLYVQVGDELITGQEVAEVGATGRSTGPHLDWRMNWMDQRIDPQLLVEKMPK